MYINLLDQAGLEKPKQVGRLNWDGLNCTVRTLITERVRQEYEHHNDVDENYANHLVRRPPSESLSLEASIARALSGFERNAFFVFINNKQVENLDDSFDLLDELDVKFIMLNPLVGG